MGGLDASFFGRALRSAAGGGRRSPSGGGGGGGGGKSGDSIDPATGMKQSTADYIASNQRRLGTTAANSPDPLDRAAYHAHAASINSKLNSSLW